MRDLLNVFTYTFKEHLKKKAFIVSTCIVVILTIIMMLIPAAITKFSKSDELTPPQNQTGTGETQKEGTLYIIDKDNSFKQDFSTFNLALPTYTYEVKSVDQEGSLIDSVKNGEDQYLVVINENNGIPEINYYFKDYMKGPDPVLLNTIFKNIYANSLLKDTNVSQEIVNKLSSPIVILENEMGKGLVQTQVACMIVMMLLFFSIYYYGYWIAMSVASEKTSRVMEILITSTKPASIIVGKTLAMGLLGLSQLVLILATGMVTYKLAFPKDFKLFGALFDFSSFTPLSITMIIIYFILGYFLYAMLNAVAGATVSKAEDVNSAIMPISMISIIAFYFAYMPAVIPTAKNLSFIASVVPFSAPFSMPGRLLTSNVPFWQIALSLFLLIACILLFVSISIKLYSSAVLHYGKRLKISELIKMSRK